MNGANLWIWTGRVNYLLRGLAALLIPELYSVSEWTSLLDGGFVSTKSRICFVSEKYSSRAPPSQGCALGGFKIMCLRNWISLLESEKVAQPSMAKPSQPVLMNEKSNVSIVQEMGELQDRRQSRRGEEYHISLFCKAKNRGGRCLSDVSDCDEVEGVMPTTLSFGMLSREGCLRHK
ncbi:hypothetical protein K432DRAFT_441795 [Lepidopterella palustris CBS 459.81]|uniref:Uncharacterized protein n=1 Tax=Lepidopterella palustris CBS 459.81 TaxID=1314670 RepID=A0A8E2JHG3_9PEZI|nr:hypothetical protein K432DRAFT_441795 [Lepidopterella palustris CBS 459.81]